MNRVRAFAGAQLEAPALGLERALLDVLVGAVDRVSGLEADDAAPAPLGERGRVAHQHFAGDDIEAGPQTVIGKPAILLRIPRRHDDPPDEFV